MRSSLPPQSVLVLCHGSILPSTPKLSQKPWMLAVRGGALMERLDAVHASSLFRWTCFLT